MFRQKAAVTLTDLDLQGVADANEEAYMHSICSKSLLLTNVPV